MKRALSIIVVIGVTALITFLAITRHMSLERAAQLDRALMAAEARMIQLEADIEAAKQRLAEVTEARHAGRPLPPRSPVRTCCSPKSPRPARWAVPPLRPPACRRRLRGPRPRKPCPPRSL